MTRTVPTSGGPKNVLNPEIQGLQRGNFNIDWELDAAGCPCAESLEPGLGEGQ